MHKYGGILFQKLFLPSLRKARTIYSNIRTFFEVDYVLDFNLLLE